MAKRRLWISRGMTLDGVILATAVSTDWEVAEKNVERLCSMRKDPYKIITKQVNGGAIIELCKN